MDNEHWMCREVRVKLPLADYNNVAKIVAAKTKSTMHCFFKDLTLKKCLG